MNVKNLNPLERHVEKIVLAIAAVGALYIGYLSLEPIYVPDVEVKIAAGDVEGEVTKAIEGLKSVRAQTAARKDLSAQMVDYVQQYQDVMLKKPLNPELTQAALVPPFAPVQQPIGASGGTTSEVFGATMEVVTPSVPMPKNVTAVSTLATVLVAAPGQNAPAVPALPGVAAPGTTKDVNWVTVSGEFPMGEFVAAMNDPSLQPNQKLSNGVQHTAIYRIEVQRHSRTNGAWSAWETIPAPTQDAFSTDWSKVTDADLPGVVTSLENGLARIAEPPLYTLANGQPAIPQVLQKEADAAAPPKVVVPVAPKTAGAVPADGAAAAAAAAQVAPAIALPDPNSLRSQANIPFWLFDEHVTPGSEYQYQVRIVMYNPTYRFPAGMKDPKMKDEPTIASGWYTVPGTVDVSADIYFFVNNNLGSGGAAGNVRVGFRVFKWTNGKWYGTEWTAQPGQPLSGVVRLIDQGNKVMDSQTGYSLVDALPSPSGNEMRAVLLSPSGELVTRSSISDSPENPKRQELETKVAKAESAAPAGPTAPAAVKPTYRPPPSRSSTPTPSNTGGNMPNLELDR